MDERTIRVAKHGPMAVLVLAIVAAIASAGLVGVGLLPEPTTFAVLPVAMGAMAVALLYQGLFILRHPQTAIEHDVHPPSKYDLSFETERGAKKVAALTLLGAVFAAAILVAVGYGLLGA